MRVLLAPELYNDFDKLLNDPSIVDMKNWVEAWLEINPNSHIYWMLPRQKDFDYDLEDVHADRDNVTVFANRRYNYGTKNKKVHGWREEQLHDLQDEVDDYRTYFDVVVNQHPESHELLWRYLHDVFGDQYCDTASFKMVKHMHRFHSAWRQHNRYRNDSPAIVNLADCAFSDGVWVKEKFDQIEMENHMSKYLSYDQVNDVQGKTEYVNSPLKFDRFDGTFSDEPQYFHLHNVSKFEGQHLDALLEIGEKLYARWDIETVVSTLVDAPDKVKDLSHVTVYERPSRARAIEIMEMCDIAGIATIPEQPGDRPMEQLASGQVPVSTRTPWTKQEVPDDYKLVGNGMKTIQKLVYWVVSNWDEAVEQAKMFREFAEERRDYQVVGENTYNLMEEMVEDTVDQHEPNWDEEVLEKSISYMGTPFDFDELHDASKKFTDSGSSIFNIYRYTIPDMVNTLRQMGYEDVGGRTPTWDER